MHAVDRPEIEHTGSVRITRAAALQILKTIGTRRAESGGLLLGPVSSNDITEFVFDESGETTATTYKPASNKLTAVCKSRAAAGLELKGIVHSHPGLQFLSQGDIRYIQDFFVANPTLVRFCAPILWEVPLTEPPDELSVEQQVRDHIRMYTVERERPSTIRLIDIEVIDQPQAVRTPRKPVDLDALARLLGADVQLDASSISLEGHDISSIVATGNGAEAVVLLPTEFPLLAPAVIVSHHVVHAAQRHVAWPLDDGRGAEERLAALLRSVMALEPL